MTTRIVELRKGILKKNDELAAELRQRFAQAGLLTLNLVSSPGTGKTAFLEFTLRELLRRGVRVAALVGDLETDNDARRLAASGAPVRQINTHGICHLDAETIGKNLEGLELANLQILFIENVGNLVCPSSYDLGERIRVALLSVTEGEDKPLKYPTLFNSADVVVVTKTDLAEACAFDRELAVRNLREIHPGIRIFECSARTGAGMEEWLEFLAEECGLRRSSASRQDEQARLAIQASRSTEPGSEQIAFSSTQEAKEFLIARIASEAERVGAPLHDVERTILYDAEEGWLPDGIKDARAVFQRFHDQEEFESRVVGLIRVLWLRARANSNEYTRWQAAVGHLRLGRDYLMELIASAEGRKRKAPINLTFWLSIGLVLTALALSVFWFGR